MRRNSLKCSSCGSDNFEVEVNYCIPRAIHLTCCDCGRTTPVAFFDTTGYAHEINGNATLAAYDETFREDVTPETARKAVRDDWRVNHVA